MSKARARRRLRDRIVSSLRRRLTFALALVPLAAACGGPEAVEVEQQGDAITVSPGLVISQLYGGGGNSGAPFNMDFVEIFNRGNTSLGLAGHSVQYTSAAGTGNFGANAGLIVVLPSVTLPPGGYFLVSLASGANGAPLPAPDATGTIAMAAGAGKVVLANVATGLGCGGSASQCNPDDPRIVDLVGYGTGSGGANLFEGAAAAPTLSNTLAARRLGGGCTETGQNGADFASGAPAPRNSASPAAPCGVDQPPAVASTAPASGASNVPADTTITVTFTEAVSVAGAWFGISCTQSGPVSAGVSGGPSAYVLDPDVDLRPGESCSVTITGSGVTDTAGNPMVGNHGFSFGIETPPPVALIRAIQGAAHLSPLAGTQVSTRGVVTVVRNNGFFIQDPAPDGSDATSEAIFVFTSSAPTVAVGDDVNVTGRVAEFRPGCTPCSPGDSAFNNLTTTELEAVTSVRVLASGVALPAPVVIGAGGRLPPGQVISDDGSPEAGATFDPASDGIDFYESLEGMRVQLNNAAVVGPTRVFTSSNSAEIVVVSDGGASAGTRTARGGVVVAPGDFNPERIFLSERPAVMPSANVGDSFPGAIVGVIDYNFANYKLLVSQLPPLLGGGLARETVALPALDASGLRVAAFNVENLDPLDPPAKFAELAGIVVTNLGAPDILALEEVQDNNGPANTGEVDATSTANLLINAISAAGGPAYQWRSVNPVNGQDGGEPGGNIRVGFLFRSDRGVAFVDRPGATAATANSVVGTGAATALQFSPGRVDPTNAAFNNSRKPLAGEFTFRGEKLFVIANHFNSKGGDQPLFGRFQPPTLSSETQRLAQANVLAGFVGSLLAANGDANVIVLGDLNDFEFSPPVSALEAAGLVSLIETLPPSERYSYVFEGNSQTLDHVLVSAALRARLTGFDVVHANAEFAVQASDHDPGVAAFAFDSVAPVITSPGNLLVEAVGPAGATVTYSASAQDAVDGPVPVICAPPSGATFALGTTTVTCTARDRAGNQASTSFTVTVADNTPPVLSNVPTQVNAFATSVNGANVNYALPTAQDLVGGVRPVTCTPAPGTRFAPGTTTVACRASDAAGNVATRSFPVRVSFSAPTDASFYRPPVRPDASFVIGSIVPVKFKLTGPSTGINNLRARLYIARVVNGVVGPFEPAGQTLLLPFRDNLFTYDPFDQQYVYLLGTLRRRGDYVLKTDLGDGVEHTVRIKLVRPR